MSGLLQNNNNSLCGLKYDRQKYYPPLQVVTLSSHPERPGDLDLLTLELARNVSRGTDNLSANFGVSATFRCRFMGKHALDWRLDLITLTFDVTAHFGDAGHRAPSLYQIVGLPSEDMG